MNDDRTMTGYYVCDRRKYEPLGPFGTRGRAEDLIAMQTPYEQRQKYIIPVLRYFPGWVTDEWMRNGYKHLIDCQRKESATR